MKRLSLEECQRDLTALDAADKLTASLKVEIDRFKEMDTGALMKKAMGMLMSGNLSLEALGLPVNLFEQLEHLEKLNGVARLKYRSVVEAQKQQLEECQRDLAALDAADKLTASLKVEIDRFKEMDTGALMKKAMGMLVSGNLSLEALGLPVNLFEQLEHLEKLNGVARLKYRSVVEAQKQQLDEIESAEVEHG